MEMYPDVFTVGIANSGVADWRLYDTIYTERYMSMLGDNPAGYDAELGGDERAEAAAAIC